MVGRLKAGPEREIFGRYRERAQALARSNGLHSIDWREIDESLGRSVEERRVEEARRLLAQMPQSAVLVSLDERGQEMSSEAFSQLISCWRDAGETSVCFVIGGPDGLDAQMRQSSAKILAFGKMTWPHQWARLMLAEQIYRALTILSGHPYHRA